MRQKIVCTLILLACAFGASAQSFTLVGRVTDEKMNPVELASVACVEQGRATLTSLKGEFSLDLMSADSVVIRFSMLGYRTKVRVLRKPRGKQTLQVVLYEDSKMLQEVNVTGQKKTGTQTQNIDAEALKGLPSVSGNAVEELVQMQAGVSTHSELSSQYNVRGGAFDENFVYINNVEVFRPFLVRSGQQEGLSVINPDMVKSIGFSTGGYDAKYGDKMSSALDITYKKLRPGLGQKTVAEGNISLSLLGASGYVGLGTKKLSWLNGLRYKTNSYLLGTLETKGEYKPSFVDYQTYLSYEPNTKWRIDFIGNISDNHYNFEPKDRETSFGTMENVKAFRVYFDGQEKDLFRTFFGSFGVTHNLTDHTSLSLITSAFHTREQEKYDIQGQYWLTQTETSEDLGVGTFFQHARNYLKANVQSVKLMGRHHNDHHDWEAAVTYKRERIEENSVEYEMRDSAGYSIPHTGRDLEMVYTMRAKNRLEANRVEAYVQDTWRFSGPAKIYQTGDSLATTEERRTRYTLNYGVRMSHWNFNRETIVSPRVALAVTPSWNQNLMLRVATGLYYQAPFYKELRDTTTVSGITYARLNEKVRSQRSIHFIGGVDYHFKMNERPFKFTGEIYYKMLGSLIPYSVNNVKVVYYGDNECSGHAAGIDLKLFGEFVPGTDSWLSLSFMNTRMKLGGKSIPLPTDQKYAVNLFFTDYFPGTTRWKMSLKLAYADGLPFSTPHKELETNSFRAPAYKRVDIGMAYRLINNEQRDKKLPFKNIWLSLDGLNLLGINNVNSYYWITDVTNHQYAVPNYLTGRQINFRVQFEF